MDMKVFEFIPEGVCDCKVTAWLHSHNDSQILQHGKRPAVIIIPGGAYYGVSDREAEPVASKYFAAGYHTFILYYGVKEKARNFQPLCQLASTVAHLRKYADEWYVEANQIAVCGFSAGGHLAASLGTLYKEPKFLEVFGREDHIRPDAMILGYPVITADEFTHVGTIKHVSGEQPGSSGYAWFGLNQHVHKDIPPTFLWHTAQDEAVPVENSLKMAAALSIAKVPFELHVMPEGPHGMSVCTKEVGTEDAYCARWMDWSIAWLNKIFNFIL